MRSHQLSNQLVARSVFGGILMGLANLVPGISGGTMLLAAGIYPRFIEAVSDVTRLRFRWQSLIVLAAVGLAAGVSVLLFAGPVKELVVGQRWIMYSLFIGLTLGGVPVVWRLGTGWNHQLLAWALVAILLMVGLAVLRGFDVVGDFPSSVPMFLVAGLAGASAMILPGLSGSYLLLLLGQYLPILSAIHAFTNAIRARDVSAALPPALTVMLPVGIGLLIGIALVGNLLQWLLKKHRNAVLGALLGLLVGSTAGLFPFQQGVPPAIGDVIKGQVIDATSIQDIDPEDWDTAYFAPTGAQLVTSLLLMAAGYAMTLGIEKVGRGESTAEEIATTP